MSAQLILMKGKPSAEFELFWGNYPIHVGKVAAARIWKRIAKDDIPALMLGLGKWKAYWQAEQKRWPDFRPPYPTTWLNQRRWEDEIPSTAAAKGKTLYEAINERPPYRPDPVTVEPQEAAQKVRALLDGLAEKKEMNNGN